MSDIFISYASQDRTRIGALVEALGARGWSVFWDTTLVPGETWRRKIERELDAARCVIVLWSQSSVASHWVEQEAEEGQRRGVLVPAMIDRVRIPLGFRSLQAADLVGWDGAAEHREFLKVVRAIEMHAPLATTTDTLVTIPASTFWMGAQKTDKDGRSYDPEVFDDEFPVHQVTLKAFRIARFPVTVREFARFVESGGYQAGKHWGGGGFGAANGPDNWAAQQRNPAWPVVGVSWFEASAYCVWAGLRLPTEAEWERVARGPTGAQYPWGDEPSLDESRVNYNGVIGHPTPQSEYPKGRSAEGIEDLLGNVWEWCSDWTGEYPNEPQLNPVGPQKGQERVLRGGSWYDGPRYVRVSIRSWYEPSCRDVNFSFRCAGDT